MTRPSLTASRQRQTLLERFCISPTACHATGAGLALSLIALIALVWAGGQRTVQTVTLNQQVVSLEELTEVVGSAEQWRDDFTAEYQASEALALRMREIGRWLPGTADWMDVEERIQAAADPLQLRIVSIRPGGEFVGTRVGVLAVNCRVEGTFEQLCRFLAALPQLEHPIVCQRCRRSPRGRRP